MTRIDVDSVTTEQLIQMVTTLRDTGYATAEQLALVVDTRRAESDNDATASDAEILAHVRDTLTLSGEATPGRFPSRTMAPPVPPP